MADILIRMEMPKDCPHCEFAAIGYASPMSSDCTLYCRAVDKFKDCATEILKDKPYEVISHYNDRPDWCPLVPLPEGHGRLIDADEFIERVRMDDRTTIIEEMHIAEILSEAPTIVPADVTDIDVGNKKEGGTENG